MAAAGDENREREIPRVLNEDISNFRAQGFEVDNDNEPAPENVLTGNDTGTGNMYQPWGSEPLDAKRVAGVRYVKPNLVSADPSMHTVLGFFLHFLPMEFF